MNLADPAGPAPSSIVRLQDVEVPEIERALAGDGLWLDIGAITLRVQSTSKALPAQLKAAYPEFPFVAQGEWADVHARLDPARGVRRVVRPQVVFSSDARDIFSPFAANNALPLMEWGFNWLIGQRTHHLLLLHAGALERDGLAVVLPALPGSGKSTLSAAMAHRGWRLLSDEFGAYDPAAGQFQAILKPVALKNESIDVLKSFDPGVRLGPVFPKTRKGDVAHMAAPAQAVDCRHDGARPAMIVLPRWQADTPTELTPVSANTAFSSIAFNAFNYQVLGEAGFDAALTIVRQSQTWQLLYSDLDDAIRRLDQIWLSLPSRTSV